jgi:hypothetical protein
VVLKRDFHLKLRADQVGRDAAAASSSFHPEGLFPSSSSPFLRNMELVSIFIFPSTDNKKKEGEEEEEGRDKNQKEKILLLLLFFALLFVF